MCLYLHAKCEVSRKIRTSFRWGRGEGGGILPPTAPFPPQNEPLKSPPRLGLRLS